MSTDEPLVSVLIPSYNRASVVQDAVQSVLQQTYRQIEVLVLDDGSTDGTEEVLANFQADDRFRYAKQENRGIARTRNALVRMARGEFLAFLDSDDVWHPKKLELQVPLFSDQAVGLVYAERGWMNETKEPIPALTVQRYRGTSLYQYLFLENFIPTSTVMVRKACFDQVGGFDESLPQSEDYDLWLKLSTEHAFDFVDQPLTVHRRWAGQITTNKLEAAEASLRVVRKFAKDNPGVLDQKTLKKSLAIKHARRGRAFVISGRNLSAIKEFLFSFWLCPSVSVIKSLIKLPLGRV